MKKCFPVVRPPSRGRVYPPSCTTKPTHGQTCYFSCKNDFQVDNNQASCRDGVWTSSPFFNCIGKIPKQPIILRKLFGLQHKMLPTQKGLIRGFLFSVFWVILHCEQSLSTLDENLKQGGKKAKQLHVENQLCHYRYDFVLHCHRSIRDELLLSRPPLYVTPRHATPRHVTPRHVASCHVMPRQSAMNTKTTKIMKM